jgi:hypothetical protein
VTAVAKLDLRQILSTHGRPDLVDLQKRPKAALAEAKKMLAHAASGPGRTPKNDLCWVVFLALVRARHAIPSAVYALLPVPSHRDQLGDSEACLAALPEAARLPAMLAAVARNRRSVGAIGVHGGLLWLERHPDPALARAVLDVAGDSELMPPSKVRPLLAKLAKKHPELASGAASSARALVVLSSVRPHAAEDLSPIAAKQVLAAAKAWDGKRATLAQRLGPDDGTETSLGRTLAVLTLGSAGFAQYDVVTLGGDSGSVFRAGTTREVAAIVQGAVECDDAKLADAIREALDAKRKRK